MTRGIAHGIARLRKQKGITQEQLGAVLGVSAPAVSKWESGRAYPDAAYLPAIARYFGVSMDELFEFTVDVSPEELEQLRADASALFGKGCAEEGIALLENTLRRYPNSSIMQLGVGSELNINSYLCSDAMALRMRRRAAQLLEQAARDETQRRVAMQLLGYVYLSLNEDTKLERVISDMSENDPWAEPLRARLYMMQGKALEAVGLLHSNLLSTLSSASEYLNTLFYAHRKLGELDDAFGVIETQLKLCELMGANGFCADACTNAATTAGISRPELCFSWIERAIDYLAQEDSSANRLLFGAKADENSFSVTMDQLKTELEELLAELATLDPTRAGLLRRKLNGAMKII